MWFDDAWNARLVLDACAKAGVAAETLLREAGVPSDIVAPTHLHIPWEQEERILLAAERLTGDPHIGLHQDAERFGERFGLPGAYILGQRTGREGVTLGWCQMGGFLCSVLEFEFEHCGETTLHRTRWKFLDSPALRHVSDMFLRYSLIGHRHMFAQPWSPLELRLLHRPVPTEEYARVFGCNVRTDWHCDEMVVESGLLDRVRPTYDPTAVAMLKPHFDAHLECMRRDLGTTLWLRDLIHRELQAGSPPSLSESAARLNISPRTLTARLAKEHTSYREIVDSVRSLSAYAMLRMPDAKVESVALQLGFSGVAPFVRAFRRWTGETPDPWRKRHAPG